MKIGKRLIAMVMVIAIILCAMPLLTPRAHAAVIVDSGTCGNSLTWTLDVDGVLTINGTGEMMDYNYDYWAQSVSSPWHEIKSNILSVVFESGVETIGEYAFYKCENLRSIAFADTIIRIKSFAFYGCASLTDLSLPESLLSMDHYVFEGCSSLKSINIGKNLIDFGTMPFSGCSDLSTINVQQGNPCYYSLGNCLIDSDEKEIILGCKNSVIPQDNDITGIADCAFYGCSKLTTITIPNNIDYVGRQAFALCVKLKEAHIKNGVERIGKSAFSGCSELEDIDLPDSIVKIEENAFNDTGYYSNEDNWENSCLYIGKHLIRAKNDYNNRILQLKDNTVSIASYAFYYDNFDQVILPDSLVSISDDAFYACRYIDSISIPSKVVYIGDNAFDRCERISEISIPDSVSFIGTGAFSDTVYYKNEDNWKNGVLYIGNHLVKAKDTIEGDYEIKKGTKTIASDAFYRCESLLNVDIPSGVVSIGEASFCHCIGLTQILIPESVTYIGYNSFSYCSNLKSINIPDGIEDLSARMFENCSALVNISLPEDLRTIGQSAFSGCSSLSQIDIPDTVELIRGSAFNNCNNLESFIIPFSLKYISAYMFYGCKKLTEIEFQDSVSLIGAYAFYETGITQIIIPDGTSVILEQAFAFSKLKSIEIPDSVQAIDTYAFYECNQLQHVVIGNGVTNIAENAFNCCFYINTISIGSIISKTTVQRLFSSSLKRLQTIAIHEDVIKLCESAFSGCSNVKTLTLGKLIEKATLKEIVPDSYTKLTTLSLYDNVEQVCENAFNGCSSLRYISIPDSVESIGQNAFEGTAWYSSKGSGLVCAGKVVYRYKGYMSSNAHIEIPDNIKTIGKYAFDGFNQMKSIAIPISVKNIEISAFNNCFSLSDIYYSSNELGWKRIAIKANNEALSLATIHYYSTGPNDVHDDEYNNYEDQAKINEKLSEYAIVSGTLDDFTTTVVLNANNKPYVSEIVIDGITYPVEGKDIISSDLDGREGDKFLLALKDNKVEWIGAFDDLFLPFVETSLNYFVYSPNQDKYISSTEKTITVKVSNSLDSSRFLQVAPGYSQSIFTTNAFKGKLEEYLRTTSNGALRINLVKLTEESENNLFEIEQPVINTDKTIGLYETAEFSFKIKAPDKTRLSGMAAKSTGSQLFASVSLSDGTVKMASASEVLIQNYDYRAPEKPWVQGISGDNANACASEAAGLLGTMAVTLQGDISQSLSKLFTQAQLDAIANTFLTEVAMYKAPKETFTETLSTKIIEKVFKCNTKLFAVGSYEIKCTFEVSTDWGPVQVQFTCSTSDYALNSNRYAFSGNITYKIISGTEKLPKDIKTEGFAGGLAGANMESFCNAVWSVAQSQLKSAYNTAYGNDLNSAVDIIFGKSVNEILSRTKYGSVSGLYWKLLTTPATSISINCPVDIFVYDSSNQMVASIIHDEVNLTTENAVATIENGTKKLQLFDDYYTIEYIPIANGTMNISIERYGFSDGLIDTTEFIEVPLEVTTTFLQDIDNKYSDESDYSLISSDGAVIPIDNYSTVFHDHVSDGVVYHSDVATCTQEGMTWGYCTVCNNYFISEVQLALEHSWSDGQVIQAPTCSATGSESYTCLSCGKLRIETIPISSDAHDYKIGACVLETCTTDGYTPFICTHCNNEIRTDIVSAVGHDWNNGYVILSPTCSTAGTIQYTCKRDGCGDSYTEPIPALGHIDEDNDGYCDREGCGEMMTGGDHCPQCGKIHNGGFFDSIVGFFHKIIYRLTHLFG